MAQLIVRHLDDAVVQALKHRAELHGRSAEAEHREILRQVLLVRQGEDLKKVLLDMPAVGEDADCERVRDLPRRIDL